MPVQLPQLPELPDDDPLVALRNLRSYIREFVLAFPVQLLFVGITVALVLVFALASVFLGFDSALLWSTDLVPFTFAVISVVVSVKTLRDEHHNTVIAFVLFLGLAGMVVIHYTKALADKRHNDEMDKLDKKLDSVGGQNGQLLSALLKPALTSGEAEIQRKQNIEKALRSEYILSHDNLSPGLLAGTEFPPSDWMNKRLQELGEKWKVAERMPSSRAPVPPPPPKLARMQFSFWSDATNSAELMPIREITVPLHGNSVTIDFTVGNVGEATATNTDIWIRICRLCSFAKEPEGFARLKGMSEQDRTRLIERLSVSTWMEKMTAEVIPPPLSDGFYVDFISSCDTCELDNGKSHKEHLVVHVSR